MASAFAFVCVLSGSLFGTITPDETVIANRAEATYQDAQGVAYSTVSQTILVSILAVPAIAVTPDETTPSAVVTPNENITRLFRLCNTGNVEDVFMPTVAETTAPATITNIFFDSDDSGTVTTGDTAVQIGQTLTPRLATGSCKGVLFVIATNNVTPPAQISISLTARSTLTSPNGTYAKDGGTILNSVGTGAKFTSPSDPSLPPLKLVDGLSRSVVLPGQTLNYTIAFRNSGTVAATLARIVDDLPLEVEYVPGTLRLNSRSLTDAADADEGSADARRIDLLIPEIGAGALTQIQFQARLNNANTIGTGVTNFAALSAANAPAVQTTNAIAIVNPIGSVYAGSSNGAVRIAGARLTVATSENGTPLVLIPDTGYVPNPENVNPFVSDPNGGFGFALSEGQIGTSTDPVRYVVTVTAPNYRPRSLELRVRAMGSNGFYGMSVHALDGQSVAQANSFSLTNDVVELSGLAALAFNIPMFEISTLQISKSADKQFAEIGDIVSYRIQVKNATSSTMRQVVVHDTLPASFVYAAGTSQTEIGGNISNVEPLVNGNDLTFEVGELSSGSSASIAYRVRIGASARQGDHLNSAFATGLQITGDRVTTEPARASVDVRDGIFSMRQIVIGRVFEDRNGNGQFDRGERPVVGARIYMNNGQSVITDSAGQYNLPGVDKGSVVLSLDPVTLPDNYRLLDDGGRKSSESWTRLLRTPLGGGSILRQNFAIAASTPDLAVSDDVKFVAAKGALISEPNKPTSNATLRDPARPIVIASLKNTNVTTIPFTLTSDSPIGLSAGTFTVAATEKIEPIAPGKLIVLSPSADEVIMKPALSISVRVAIDWNLEVEVNGDTLDAGSIGETRVDNRNQVTTYSYVGINLRPGANLLKLTSVGKTGVRGLATEIRVFGRGPVEKLEINPATGETGTGGRGNVTIEIRGTDALGNPAADGQVSIETSAGKLFVQRSSTGDTNSTALLDRQQMISLENGRATVQLIADGSADVAHIKVVAGQLESKADVRFTAEMRPTLMVGLAEMEFGRAAPGISSTGDDENYRGRLAFYYRGRFLGDNLLTLAYDSQRSLNRVGGVDRVGGFDPLDRAYPIFGDSSSRFEDAQSNSKLYVRVDRGRSYAMFGDFDADLDKPTLSGYTRRLTGVKLHLENAAGDFISLTGARPNTAFSRDVIPGGGLSIVRLSHGDLLQGSEVVTIEVRDRRNPEIVLSFESLIRSIDYNIDSRNGEIFFLRSIPTFDPFLNLIQVVVTYEHRGGDTSNYVYTGRAVRTFQKFGVRAGASYVNQQQGDVGTFHIGGVDLEKTLPRDGRLNVELAMSNGRFASGVNVFNFYNGEFNTGANDSAATRHNGMAIRVKLDQPLPFFKSRIRADFQRSTEDFMNPFGATISPGNQRVSAVLEMRPTANRAFSFGFIDERNLTRNVDNSRQTFSVLWSEQWRENLRTILGFDRRHFSDDLTGREVNSNLLTAAIEYRPTSKIELSIKREQNLAEADPTYPDQTTFAAKYQLNQSAKLFFTQRLASAPITPIGDVSGTGFASTGSRHETAFGIETKIPRLGALNGRYQLENGLNGTDGFAVIGLQNRWALNKEVSVEAGFERGFLVNGTGKSFVSGTFGAAWTPIDGFRAAARYEVRDRGGLGQLFTIGAAGRIGDNWTTLARGQWTRSNFNQRSGSSSTLTGALAYRPIDSDKYALLFSYNQRSTTQSSAAVNGVQQGMTRDRSDTLSTDGLYQVNKRLELYGRFALRFNGNGNNTNLYASALTYSGQLRAQQRINDHFDFATEARWMAQPSSDTRRTSIGAELGYWVLADLRFGIGYNFAGVREIQVNSFPGQTRSGFYFTITSKLSNVFDLFGTSDNGLRKDRARAEPESDDTPKDE